MSQTPPSPFQQPSDLPYSSGNYANYAPERPGVVGGLAVTGIILGSLGILCSGLGLLGQIFILLMGKSAVFAKAPMMHDPAINAFNVANATIDLGICIVLLAFSIAALNLKPIAHTALIRWSVLTLIWVTLAFIAQVVWILPATADFVLKQQANTARTAGMAAGYRVGQVIGAGFVWLIYCTLPVLFLLLWRTPRVLAAFGKAPTDTLNPGFPKP